MATRFAKVIQPNSTNSDRPAATQNRSSPLSKPLNAHAVASTICASASTVSSDTSSRFPKRTLQEFPLSTNVAKRSRTPNASPQPSSVTGKRKSSELKNASSNWKQNSSPTSAARSPPKQNAFR